LVFQFRRRGLSDEATSLLNAQMRRDSQAPPRSSNALPANACLAIAQSILASSAPLKKYFSKPLMRERRNSVEKVIETQSNGSRAAM